MKRFFHVAFFLLAILLAVKLGCVAVNVGGGGPGALPAKYKQTRSMTAPATPGAAGVVVNTRTRAITLRRGDTPEARITARLAATTPERLHAARIVAEVRPDGALLVTVKWPDDKPLNNESCAFDIALPAAVAAVTAETSNGPIDLAGLSGLAQLCTSNGRITVADHAGPVHAATSNGAVALKQIAGDADARTSNGAIELTEVAGRATAHTSNGRVTILLGADSGGPVEVRTSNGAADVTVPSSYSGRFALSTSNGSIAHPQPPAVRNLQAARHHATFALGAEPESGAESTVTTSNGSIELRVR